MALATTSAVPGEEISLRYVANKMKWLQPTISPFIRDENHQKVDLEIYFGRILDFEHGDLGGIDVRNFVIEVKRDMTTCCSSRRLFLLKKLCEYLDRALSPAYKIPVDNPDTIKIQYKVKRRDRCRRDEPAEPNDDIVILRRDDQIRTFIEREMRKQLDTRGVSLYRALLQADDPTPASTIALAHYTDADAAERARSVSVRRRRERSRSRRWKVDKVDKVDE